MSQDVGERLRQRAGNERKNNYGFDDGNLDVEAADEIERLRSEYNRLQSAYDQLRETYLNLHKD